MDTESSYFGGEARNPLQILPKEMWCEMFEYLKEEPRDIIKLSETCTDFREILQLSDQDLNALRLEEVIPLVLQWVNRKGLLNCRLLCKRIRNTMDKVLDNVGLLNPYDGPNLFPRLKLSSGSPYSFEWQNWSTHHHEDWCAGTVKSLEETERRIKDVEQKAVSKVVYKSLAFDLSWSNDNPPSLIPPNFVGRMVSLLTVLGERVHRIWIIDQNRNENCDLTLLYDVLQKCVGALPHLRCLQLSDSDSNCENNSLDEDIVGRLDRYISDGRPLPPAPLERFVVDGYPTVLLKEVFRQYSRTLKMLEITLTADRSYRGGSDEEFEFPVLNCLKVHDAPWGWQPIFESFRADQLKELHWAVNDYSNLQRNSTALLFFRVLLHFPSVTTTRLDVGDEQDMMDSRAAMQELRGWKHDNVKNLKLIDSWHQIPLQFFARRFPNLESIYIQKSDDFELESRAWGNRRTRIDPDLKLCVGKQMERSNLWRLLPKLTKFKWDQSTEERRNYSCIRAEAEAFQNRSA